MSKALHLLLNLGYDFDDIDGQPLYKWARDVAYPEGMDNPYEEGSEDWALFECGLEQSASDCDYAGDE